MKTLLLIGALTGLWVTAVWAGPFAPAAGQPGSTAIAATDSRIVAWARGAIQFQPGPQDISEFNSPLANFGTPASALGPSDARLANGDTSIAGGSVVSLGDGGQITLQFALPIGDGPGPDFAVFENGFIDTYLELAFVEVSSNGQTFYRFPSVSLTQTAVQIDQADDQFSEIDPTNIDGLAGKYRVGFGTPFDLSVLQGRVGLNLQAITHVRIVDVVGSVLPEFGRYDDDPAGPHLINDPWPNRFASSGFDLDAVGVLNQGIPEPSSLVLCGLGLAGLLAGRARGRLRR